MWLLVNKHQNKKMAARWWIECLCWPVARGMNFARVRACARIAFIHIDFSIYLHPLSYGDFNLVFILHRTSVNKTHTHTQSDAYERDVEGNFVAIRILWAYYFISLRDFQFIAYENDMKIYRSNSYKSFVQSRPFKRRERHSL